MKSENYRQLLNNEFEAKEMTKEDFDNTLMHFAMLYHKEQLKLYGVGSSLTSKEEIYYEIYAKRKEKEENLKGWVFAMLFSIIFFVGLFAMLKSCSS